MPNAHPRSAAVTAAATLTLLNCACVFFFWGYFLLSLLNAPADAHGRHVYQLYPGPFLLISLVPPAVVAMGIRTGIGLFRLRPWARLAALLWAGLTLAFCLWLIAWRPFETFVISDRFVAPAESMRQLVSVALLILLLPTSVWWLFLFRMESVKLQFGCATAAVCQSATVINSTT